jgi:hypothetical protein
MVSGPVGIAGPAAPGCVLGVLVAVGFELLSLPHPAAITSKPVITDRIADTLSAAVFISCLLWIKSQMGLIVELPIDIVSRGGLDHKSGRFSNSAA